MSTAEEKTVFLSKRNEFRTYIRRLVDAQKEQKAEFRQRKAETTRLDRQKDPSILNYPRTDIVHAGLKIRYLLLAYAMFRGKPYARVEQKAATPVRAYNIWEALRRVGLEEKYTKAGIELWLSGRIPDFQIDIAADGSVSTKYTDGKIPESVFEVSA